MAARALWGYPEGVPRRRGGVLRVGRSRALHGSRRRRPDPAPQVPGVLVDPRLRPCQRRPQGCRAPGVLRLVPPARAPPRRPVPAPRSPCTRGAAPCSALRCRARGAARGSGRRAARSLGGGAAPTCRGEEREPWAERRPCPTVSGIHAARRRSPGAPLCGRPASLGALRPRPQGRRPSGAHGDGGGEGRQGAPGPGARPLRRGARALARGGTPRGRRSRQSPRGRVLEPPGVAARAARRSAHPRPALSGPDPSPCPSPLDGDAPPRRGGGPACGPRAPRARQPSDDPDLHPREQGAPRRGLLPGAPSGLSPPSGLTDRRASTAAERVAEAPVQRVSCSLPAVRQATYEQPTLHPSAFHGRPEGCCARGSATDWRNRSWPSSRCDSC